MAARPLLRSAKRWWRPYAVLLIAAVAVTGVHARRVVGLDTRPRHLPGGSVARTVFQVGGLVVGTLAVALLVALGMALWRRPRKSKDLPPHVHEQPSTGFAGRVLALALALAAVGAAAGATLLVARLGGGGSAVPPASPATTRPHVPARPRPQSPPAGTHTGWPWWLAAGAALLAVLVLVAVVVLVRARRGDRSGVRAPAAGSTGAVPSGRAGHAAVGPRAEVIGTYARMEADLAAGRSPRARSETPEEALERVAAQGRAGPATRDLTERYLSARYSSRPVTPEDSEQAARAYRHAREEAARRATPTSGEEPS